MSPFIWLPEHVSAIRPTRPAPPFSRSSIPDVLPGHDVWDHWPVTTTGGIPVTVAEGFLIVALVAPRSADPDTRHGLARTRLFHSVDGVWRDMGPMLPAGFAPGDRTWSGSATLSDDTRTLRLFFTAVGEDDGMTPSYKQRLFEAAADLSVVDGRPVIAGWRALEESLCPGGRYESDMEGDGAIGSIKAFRDPFFFRDPSQGAEWLLFTASDATVESRWNGLVGAARREEGRWIAVEPLVSAEGLNNELERPHAIEHGGSIYLFWSTQASVFAPTGPVGPTGLYGVIADGWGAPWRPLNGSCLVIPNPTVAPIQAYSFQVLPDLSVWSFADMPGAAASSPNAADRRLDFVGGPAPTLRLDLDGDRAEVIG